MEFRKFPSLENTYKDDVIQQIKMHPRTSAETWVVTEKLDGSNFAFYCNGHDLKVASRNQFTDESFHNCKVVIDNYSCDIFDLFFELKHWKQCEGIIVYGELYGNGIQGRINYGDKDFRVFDIYVDGEPLGFNTAHSLISDSSKLKFVPGLWIFDTFDEALEYNETFRSRLTPTGHDGDNWAEGIVISPSRPMYFENGSRVYLKKKSGMFSEKGKKRTKKVTSFTPEQQAELDIMMEYVNDNRVMSAVSKIGVVTNKDFGKLLGLTVQEAIEEYMNDGNPKPDGDVRKQLNKESAGVVREVFLELI